MDVQVICDIPDTPGVGEPLPAADLPEQGPAVRRFVIDPASSPALLAALAWDAVSARR